MEMTYVCSPLSAPSRAERLANAAKATTYMIWAEKEFGGRAVAPHAYLPYLLDDSVPEQRALALDFGLKLLGMCSRLVAFGDRLSAGMKKEIEAAHEQGIPVFYRTGICTESKPAVKRTPVIVGRPINGVTLNGLEYLQDEDGVPIYFEDRDAARKYLREHGVTDDEMEDMEFRESNGTCRFCGSPLFPSDVEEYTYQCFQCDEDFYSIEQSPVSNSLNAEVNG